MNFSKIIFFSFLLSLFNGALAQVKPVDSVQSNVKHRDSLLNDQISNKKHELINVNVSLDSLDKKIQEKNKLILIKEKFLFEKSLKIKELSEQNKTYLTGFRWVAALILFIIGFFLLYGIWNFKINKKIPEEIKSRYPFTKDPFINGMYKKYIVYLKLSRLVTMLLFLFVTIAVILFSYIIIVVVFNNNFNNVEILINNKFWDFILASGFPLAFVTVVYNTVETKRAEVENFIMDKVIIREEVKKELSFREGDFFEN